MDTKTINILKNSALKWPDKTAIYHNDTTTSFENLFDETLKLSKLLKERVFEKGSGIALLTGNNKLFITGLFACSSTGMVVMPVWKNLASLEIESALECAFINLLLIEKNISLTFSEENTRINIDENFDLIIFNNITSESIINKFPDAAFIRPSSGTTGRSKGVVISHRAVFERIDAANQGLKLNEEDKVLWVLPMAFHFLVSIILYIKYGTGIIISDDFYAESILENANKHKATMLYASPLHYRLLNSYGTDRKFDTLKTAICTSAGLEVESIAKFQEKFKLSICQAYGIIEIGLPLINNDPAKSGSIGKALPAYQANIFDDEMNPLPACTNGDFAIKGPGMFSGYLWPQQPAEKVFYQSWFMTGDIAQMDLNGFVSISGRKKSVINISGNKVFPEEVENVLRSHPEIADVRVYKGTHALTGELVEAEIILAGNSHLSTMQIVSYCRKHLADIKIPQRIVFVGHINKTKTGKTIR